MRSNNILFFQRKTSVLDSSMQHANSRFNQKIGIFLVSVFLLWSSIPFVQSFFGYYVSKIYLFAVSFLLLIGIGVLNLNNKTFFKKSELFFFSIVAIISFLLFYLLGFVDSLGHMYSSFLFWSMLAVYQSVKDDKRSKKALFIIAIVVLVFDSLTSYIGLSQDQSLSRLITSSTIESIDDTMLLYRKNIVGISFFQAVILLVAPLSFLVKKSNFYGKILTIVSLIFYFVLLLTASYTIPVFVFAFGLILSLSLIESGIKTKLVMFYFVIIALFLPWSSILSFVSSHITNDYISARLAEMVTLLNKNNPRGDLSLRLDLYKRSFNTFLNHPLGIGPYYKNIILSDTAGIGYHSQFLDDLARYGLFSLLYYSFFFFHYYKLLKNEYGEQNKGIPMVICIIYFVLLFFNLGFSSIFESVVLFIVLPFFPIVMPTKGKSRIT